MSGSTDPLLESMEVPLTDNEMSLLNQGKCPNCHDHCLGAENLIEGTDFTEPNLATMKMKYFIKCGSCLTDYTVYLDVRHVTHIVTFKNGERFKCQDEILKIAQAQQTLKNIRNEENNT